MSRTIKRKQFAYFRFYGNVHQYLEYQKGRSLHWAHIKCSYDNDYSSFGEFYAKEYTDRSNCRDLALSHRTVRGTSPGKYFRKQTVSKGRVHSRKELHKVLRDDGYEPYCRHDEKHAGYWD